MFNARQYTNTMALLAVVLGIIVSLASATLTALPEDEPLSTSAVAMPLHSPAVAEYPPDSRKDFNRVAQPVTTPSVKPAEPPKVVKPVPHTVRKPKPPAEPPQHAPAPPVTQANTRTETAVAYALSKLGKPYVWGATGPNAFDCSGLVVTAFKQAGISLPRTTKTIIGKGKPVSRNAMVRGDLVWTSSGHMGIYLGGNKMVHAPQTGDVVKISTVWSFYAARRL